MTPERLETLRRWCEDPRSQDEYGYDCARELLAEVDRLKARDEPHQWSDPYNDGYTHEALHTAHVLLSTWDDHVSETRCAEQFPDVAAASQRAIDAMHDCYQLIGQKFANDPEPKP